MTFLLAGDSNEYETVTVEAREWDSQVLGLRTARINEIIRLDRAVLKSSTAPKYLPLIDGLTRAGFEYVTARRPQSEWAQIHRLENAGFRALDGILEFALTLDQRDRTARAARFPLRLAAVSDAVRLAELSARTFTLSRFHNDPLLTRAQADRVFYEWARNSCLGVAAQAVWICEDGDRPLGLITCKLNGQTGIIDLVGVDSAAVGHGVGSALVHKAFAWFIEQGCARVTVQTQTSNLAAIHLYSKLGFKPSAASLTLRWAPGSR